MGRAAFFLLVAALVSGCAKNEDPARLYLKIVGHTGSAGEALTGAITYKYISEKRYLRVSYPGLANPTEAQENAALSAAGVQPAYRESDPNGAAYLMCTAHESNPAIAHAMLSRCQEQLTEVAKSVGVTLVPVQE